MAKKTKIVVAAVATLIGLVIYLITSMTGYLAAAPLDLRPAVAAAAALVLMAALLEVKMPPVARDLLTIVAGVLVIVSFSLFALGRVTLAADVYFIPVNYPPAEATALHLSIAGLVFDLIAILAMIVEAFTARD